MCIRDSVNPVDVKPIRFHTLRIRTVGRRKGNSHDILARDTGTRIDGVGRRRGQGRGIRSCLLYTSRCV